MPTVNISHLITNWKLTDLEAKQRLPKSTGHFHVWSQVGELRYKFDNLMLTIASVQIHIFQQ